MGWVSSTQFYFGFSEFVTFAKPLTAFAGGLRHLHEASPDATEWLTGLPMKLCEFLNPNEQHQNKYS